MKIKCATQNIVFSHAQNQLQECKVKRVFINQDITQSTQCLLGAGYLLLWLKVLIWNLDPNCCKLTFTREIGKSLSSKKGKSDGALFSQAGAIVFYTVDCSIE